MLTSQALRRKDTTDMHPVPFPGGGGGNRYVVLETFLHQEYSHGLAPEERHVRPE